MLVDRHGPSARRDYCKSYCCSTLKNSVFFVFSTSIIVDMHKDVRSIQTFPYSNRARKLRIPPRCHSFLMQGLHVFGVQLHECIEVAIDDVNKHDARKRPLPSWQLVVALGVISNHRYQFPLEFATISIGSATQNIRHCVTSAMRHYTAS